MDRSRAAKAAEGAKIHQASAPIRPRAGLKHARIRLYVSDAYRRQHGDWKQQWSSVLQNASEVVEPWFGVRFELVATTSWSPKCPEAELRTCLDELATLDPAEDGDWVIGVLGSAPRFTAALDELGRARVPGRHMVLRDVSDLSERDAVDRAFDSYTVARRDDIYKRRKTHKRLAIFLHEWGHTLGALHAPASDSLLHPNYDDRMQSYDSPNHKVIEAGLRDRFGYNGQHDQLIAALRVATEADWMRGERKGLLARLEGPTGEPIQAAAGAGEQGAVPAHHPFVIEGEEPVLLAGLEPAEQADYREAVRLTLSQDPVRAWHLIYPLSERHHTSRAVQHLTCGLAMQLGAQSEAQTVCPRVEAQ